MLPFQWIHVHETVWTLQLGVPREGGLWILRRVLSARDARTWDIGHFLRALFWQCSVCMSPQEYMKM